MRVLDLAFKDLSQILRDRRALLFLVAMPMGFTLFMGFAYQSGRSNAPADPRQPLGWVNEAPDSALARQLQRQLEASDAVRLVALSAATGEEALRQGNVAGLLVVPADFDAGLTGAVPPLKLVTDLASAPGQTLYQTLRAAVTRLFSVVEVARLSAALVGQPADAAEYNTAFTAAAKAWDGVDSAQHILSQQAVAPASQAWYGDNPYNQASPGILVQFAIFGLVTSGQILVQERQSRTLQRMLTTSLSPAAIIAGHALAMFALVLLQELLLVAFGQWVLGVNYARAPLGILLVTVALGAWVAALGLLVGVVAKDDSQVILFSLLAMFLFSALGGTWFPLEAAAGPFAALGQSMPSAWAMTGYQNILIRGLGSESAWGPAAALALYALGFFGLAVWRFQRIER